MANENNWAEYVDHAIAGVPQAHIAEKTGLAQSAISRWLRGDTDAPRAEYAVIFARALDRNPIEALIAAGYITAEEAGAKLDVKTPLSEYSNYELIRELARRNPPDLATLGRKGLEGPPPPLNFHFKGTFDEVDQSCPVSVSEQFRVD